MEIISKYLEFVVLLTSIGGIIFGAFKWVTTLNKNVKDILDEIKPNSGRGSMKDNIDKIDKQITLIEKNLNHDSNLINTICTRQKWILDNRPEPIFECDTNGNCTWVNEKYCQLLKHDVDYFLGNGWKNGVHAEDLEMVEREWDKSIKDKRSSVSTHRLVDREGNVYNVKVTANRSDDFGYIGNILILDDKKNL